MDIQRFVLGPLQENCYLVRTSDQTNDAVIIDPGAEADFLIEQLRVQGIQLKAILVTHTHFDHVGAIAQLAPATSVPVYCPAGEADLLFNLQSFAFPELGPFEGYKADHLLEGGEKLQLAGLDIEVITTPGHSPAHLTYAVAPDGAPKAEVLFCGDVLFAGTVGRTDIPGSDRNVLQESLKKLIKFAPETVVYPGHSKSTTISQELATNPFLQGMKG